MEMPSTTSSLALRIASLVKRFKVPYTSFEVALSKTPHAHPCGVPSQDGSRSNSGMNGNVEFSKPVARSKEEIGLFKAVMVQ